MKIFFTTLYGYIFSLIHPYKLKFFLVFIYFINEPHYDGAVPIMCTVLYILP